MSYLDVVLNDSDPEFDPLAVTRIVTQPATRDGGTSTPTARSPMRARPAGHRHLHLRGVRHRFNACDTAEVTVTIGSNNDNPTPMDDDATTVAGDAVSVDVLKNDTDPDDDTLTLNQVEDPAHGTATIVDDEVVYTPDPDFVGTDIFFYSVCDANNACATAFIIVEVTPGDVNTPPTAVDDTLDTPENTPVKFDSTTQRRRLRRRHADRHLGRRSRSMARWP